MAEAVAQVAPGGNKEAGRFGSAVSAGRPLYDVAQLGGQCALLQFAEHLLLGFDRVAAFGQQGVIAVLEVLIEFFANFGLGFHSNDARGVTTTVDPKSGDPVSKVTPLVGTQGGEIGVRTQILPDAQVSLALWRLDLDSELLFTGDAGTTEPSRASRRQGIELSTRWQPIRWLLFDVDWAWSRVISVQARPASR